MALAPFTGGLNFQTAKADPGSLTPTTKLTVGLETDLALRLSGELDKLPFQLEVVNITGGPSSIAAFHANALDVAIGNDIPPIEAEFIGLDPRIVAVTFRKDTDAPEVVFGIAPKAQIKTLADLRGKRIAYSPGQMQGAVVLRTLALAGLKQSDVTLVELPSVGQTYFNALISHLVDAAPIGGITVKRYLDQYGQNGASILVPHGLKQNPLNLWTQAQTLQDPAKVEAIKRYLFAWGRSQRWIEANQQQWTNAYYVGVLGLSPSDAAYIVQWSGTEIIPTNWDEAIKSDQETADFMADQTGHGRFNVAGIFDRRFESIAGDGFDNLNG
jgi:sulfonate transport system substrate-binding protein